MKKLALKSEQGFTLVELMVVVAIIGILSAIAVPNFKKYQAKSKQSEAKIQLAALYQTEISAQADYNTYATCITDLGYETSPRGYYNVGFSGHYAAGSTLITGTIYNGTCGATNFNAKPTAFLKVQGVDAAASDIPAPPAGVTTIAFLAGAAGQISSSNSAYDKWTINESKALINSVQGF